MFHRQIRIAQARLMDLGQHDNARCVFQNNRHEDVIHRVQRLQVKNGQLQIMSGNMVPALFTAKVRERITMTQGSRSMLQLDPPIPVDTPKGEAMAMFLLDYGPDYDLMWVTFINETGQCWTWKNQDIRGVKNVTLGRRDENRRAVAGRNDNQPIPAPVALRQS